MKKFIYILSVFFLLSYCKKEKAGTGTPLAEVGDIIITEEELRAQVPEMASQFLGEEQKGQILNLGIEATLFYLAARDEKLLKEPGIRDKIKWMERLILADEYLRRNIQAKITITTEEVKDFYKKYEQDFSKELDIVYIIGKDRKKVEELRSRIKRGTSAIKIMNEIQNNPDFIVDYLRELNMGELKFYPALPGALLDALFTLKIGEVSSVTPLGTEGYGLVYVCDIAKSNKPIEEIERSIHFFLLNQKAQVKKDSLLQVLKTKYTVKIFEK